MAEAETQTHADEPTTEEKLKAKEKEDRRQAFLAFSNATRITDDSHANWLKQIAGIAVFDDLWPPRPPSPVDDWLYRCSGTSPDG